jgi:hypothetical protein
MNENFPTDALAAALPPEFDDLRADIARFLAVMQMPQPSEKTRATYERAYERMFQRRVSPEVMGARSRRSFQLYRAALVYMVLTELESFCRLACSGLVFDFTHAIPAGAYTSSISSKVALIETATYTVSAFQAGTNFNIVESGAVVTLQDPTSLPNVFPAAAFSFVNTSTDTTTLNIEGGAVFVGFAVSGLTSLTLQPLDYLTIVADGANYRVLSASPNLSGVAEIVQAQAGNYAVDTGTVNAIAITLSPAPASLAALIGAPLRVKVANTITGPSTININQIGSVAIQNPDGTPLSAAQLFASGVYTFVYNGTAVVLQSISGYHPGF